MTQHAPSRSAPPEALACLGAFVLVTAAVVAADWMTLGAGENLLREGGGVEKMSMLGYLVAAALYLWKRRARPLWAIPVLLVAMAAREFDLDKAYTSEGVLSTKILFYDTPIWEKFVAIAVWAVLITALVSLIRRGGPVLMRGLKRRAPWALWFAAGLLLAVFADTIDGLARKLAPIGIEVSRRVGQGAGALEEAVELLIPMAFMPAILHRAAARRKRQA